jgi:predicted SnoaL-like aldol condensation-catalyzing enzyme
MKIAVAFTVASLAASAAFAANVPGSAKGMFKSQGVTMEVRSAIAYRGKSFFDKKDALIVAITNAQMTDGIADYYDRRLALDKRIKDAQTGVVYLEFKPDGAFRGFSYYFGTGNGCGFCSGEPMSSVKLSNGRLAGSVQSTEKERTMNVTLDLPVLSDDHGPALAADGGAPGAVYLAYDTALKKRDAAAVRTALSADLRDTMAQAEKKNDFDGFVRWLLRDHPDKSVRIVKGYAKGDTAVLVVSGESSAGKVAGEVMMRKEDGRWRVDDEMTDVVIE